MRAGIGVTSITPTPPVWLAGFGDRKEPAQKVHDDLQARALFLEDGDTKLCLIVCDLLGMTQGFSDPVRESIASALATPASNVLTACTHTHNGPSVMAGAEALGWVTPEGYKETLVRGCTQAAERALDAVQEATFRYGRAPLPERFSFNRRGLPYADPSFAVLDISNGGGDRIGVVANLGIHPVLLGPQWLEVSADWVGPFRTELERLLGGTAIELTGALGDVNPTPPGGKPDNTYAPWASWEQTESYGRDLASTVAQAVEGAEPIEATIRALRSESVDLPVGSTGLARLAGADTMSVEFVEWSLGDVRIVSMPGEAFFALGREVERARNSRTLLAGISPAWHGYLPHPFGEGYEEGLSYGAESVSKIRAKLTDCPS